jgi:hypothetical protein
MVSSSSVGHGRPSNLTKLVTAVTAEKIQSPNPLFTMFNLAIEMRLIFGLRRAS